MSVANIGLWVVGLLAAGAVALAVTFAAAHFLTVPGEGIWRRVTRVLRVVWWCSAVWLLALTVVIVVLMVGWAFNTDPRRYEAAIIAMLLAVYSWPAGVGILTSSVASDRTLSGRKRMIGVGLCILVVGLMLAFDLLTARYR